MKLYFASLLAALMFTSTTCAQTEGAQSAADPLVVPAQQCPSLPGVFCYVNPCIGNPCGQWRYCCPDYRFGCNYICRRY